MSLIRALSVVFIGQKSTDHRLGTTVLDDPEPVQSEKKNRKHQHTYYCWA